MYYIGPGQSTLQIPSPDYIHTQQQQGWSASQHQVPFMGSPQGQHHQRTPSSSSVTVFPPIVPSSSPGYGDYSDSDMPSAQPTLSVRYNTALAWFNRTSPQLTPAQIQIAQHILRSSWWEMEVTEPELRSDDILVQRGLINAGGSRFRAFLDEEKGWMCTFDHDGAPCQHGKGRMERALGTVRGFFVYKPVQCGGACGSRWCVCSCFVSRSDGSSYPYSDQRFVSVEQCQKHVQKKRSGRVACQEW